MSTLLNMLFCSTEAQSTDHAARAVASFTGRGGSGKPFRPSPSSPLPSSSLAPKSSAWPACRSATAAATASSMRTVAVASMCARAGASHASSPPICSRRSTEGATLRHPSTEAAGITGEA